MRTLPLSNSSSVAIISDRDFKVVASRAWRIKIFPKWGLRYAITGKGLFMHTLILPNAGLIDHKDFDGLNNQRSNLRPCSPSQSAMNRRKISGTSSRYKGVSWHKHNRKWMANIERDGRKFSLGGYDNPAAAAKAYNRAARQMFGQFACLNKV